jgi:D-alanyl-D-alanine carboxypeptidase
MSWLAAIGRGRADAPYSLEDATSMSGNTGAAILKWNKRIHIANSFQPMRGRWLRGAPQALGLMLASCIAAGAAEIGQKNSLGRVTSVDSELCDDMKARHVLADGPLTCARLRLVTFSYIDFDGISRENGEVVVMDAAAGSVLNVFNALLRLHFPIAKAQLINSYGGDDDASMADNNTSAFNNRKITRGDSISLHAYGLAIDINPIQNPYIKREDGSISISPPVGSEYVTRSDKRPGMTESIVNIFAENGFFVWGGSWSNPIDYQHFQTGRKMAERLALASPADAQGIFSIAVERYRSCRQTTPDSDQVARNKCIAVADPTAQ